jgi:cyclase
MRKSIVIPLTALGGAGTTDHLRELISRNGIIGAAAGSLFVFKGKYRAVLINYPNREEKNLLIQDKYKL